MRDIEIILAIVSLVIISYFVMIFVAFLVRPKIKEEEWQDGDAGPHWGKDGN